MITGKYDGKHVRIDCYADTPIVEKTPHGDIRFRTRIWSMEQTAGSPSQAEQAALDYMSKRGTIETINWIMKGKG